MGATPEHIHILQWEHDVTLKNVDEFRKAVSKLQETESNAIVLNLEQVSYLNSAALGVIADGVLSARRKGQQLVVGGIRPSVEEIFRIVKFETFMHLFMTVEEAVAHLNPEA